MTSPEVSQPKEHHELLDAIRDVLEHVAENIQKEVMRTDSVHQLHWLGAFKSQITAVQGYLEMAEEIGEITSLEAESSISDLETLTTKTESLRAQYEPDNLLLPADLQHELLEELDVLHLMQPEAI